MDRQGDFFEITLIFLNKSKNFALQVKELIKLAQFLLYHEIMTDLSHTVWRDS